MSGIDEQDEQPTVFQATDEQRAGARRTALIIVGLVVSMIILATISKILGW